MIVKQYKAVILKLKTETRRTSEKDTYKIGSTHSVVPKRACPTVYYRWLDGELKIWHEYHANTKPMQLGIHSLYTPLKVHILNKHWEPLHAIDEAGAIAEGIIECTSPTGGNGYTYLSSDFYFHSAVAAYADLWDSINGKSKEFRWDANPQVCVHKFELVQP